MSAREVYLEGPSPWGFRMNGGADVGHPLRISRVNPGSKAAQKGVREGDLITSINGQSTKCLTNSESHSLLRTVKENLRLGLNEDRNVSPKRRSKEITKQTSSLNETITVNQSSSKGLNCEKPSSSKFRRQRRAKLKYHLKKIFGFGKNESTASEQEEPMVHSEPDSSPPQTPKETLEVAENNNIGETAYDNIVFSQSSGTAHPHTAVEVTITTITEVAQKADVSVIADTGCHHQPVTLVAPADESVDRSGSERRVEEVVPNTKSAPSVNENGTVICEMSPGIWQTPPGPCQHELEIRETTPEVEESVPEVHETAPRLREAALEIQRVLEDVEGRDPTRDIEECLQFLKEERISSSSLLPPVSGGKTVIYANINPIETVRANKDVELGRVEIVVQQPEEHCAEEVHTKDPSQAPLYKDVEDDYELVDTGVHSEVMYSVEHPEDSAGDRKSKPYTCPPNYPYVYYYTGRRYLEVISEENSDISDGDKPWENSELIRKINDIEGIPEDWHSSQDGIDTSWQNGKSLEEVSDVQVVSDSHSDTDFTSDSGKKDRQAGGSSCIKKEGSKESLKSQPKVSDKKVCFDPNVTIESVADLPESQQVESQEVPVKHVPSKEVVKNVVSSYYNKKFCSTPVTVVAPSTADVQREARLEQSVEKGPSIVHDIELVYIDSSDSDVTSVKSEILNIPKEKSRTDYEDLKDNLPVEEKKAVNVRQEKDHIDAITNNHKLINELAESLQHMSDDYVNMVDHSFGKRKLLETERRGIVTPENVVVSLRELSGNVVRSLPCGQRILNELRIDNKEDDSNSDYGPETSEYSYSSGTNLVSLPSEVNKSLMDITDERRNDCFEYAESTSSSGVVFISESSAVKHESSESLDTKWIGVPTVEDPRVMLCVSPSQSKRLPKNSQLASDLLDLHTKFIYRRGYYEQSDCPSQTTEPDLISIGFKDQQDPHKYIPEILYQAENHVPLKPELEERESGVGPTRVKPVADSTEVYVLTTEGGCWERKCTEEEVAEPKSSEMEEVKSDRTVGGSRLLELIQSVDPDGTNCAEEISESANLTEPEKKEKNTQPSAEDELTTKYKISKQGDIAVYKSSAPGTTGGSAPAKPKTLPPPGEVFRKKMYEEYMDKVAERTERRQQKVIKLSTIACSALAGGGQAAQVENEFMEKVKERMLKLGIPPEDQPEANAGDDNIPKHVQEFMEMMEQNELENNKELMCEIRKALTSDQKDFLYGRGVWSPSQTPETERKKYEFSENVEKGDNRDEKNEDDPPVVWTPPSTGNSPTLERKFRTINFQSPTQKRKEYKPSEEHPQVPKDLPQEDTFETITRLVTSKSENSTLSSSHLRLPTAQNPTITLLQKAREGQLPKGAQYLEEKSNKEVEETASVVRDEHRVEYENKQKTVVDSTPRKFVGIGPTTREGTPIALRSEIKEDNQQRWYKRMYDSLHKAEQDKDYVTVRYKTKRKGQYPYSSAGGYLSEPDRLAYDSDASTISKYATLDRRRVRNRDNEFTTSTMPRNKYTPAVKHAVNVYKNQPGRIENYEPGHSSIAEKEAKQWWDEIMEIFDEELNKDSRTKKPPTTFTVGKPIYGLKDTGYDSDSTLVFKRREGNMDERGMSSAEQKTAYKIIQQGGEVPLHGLRKPAPQRPKEDSEIEYFPLSPTLTRIRIHKKSGQPQEDIYCPPVNLPIFSMFKRTARSAVAPSPPRRKSSRNISTLKPFGSPKPLEIECIKSCDLEKSPAIPAQLKPQKTKTKCSIYGMVRPRSDLLSKSPDLKAPAEVKKVLKETKVTGKVPCSLSATRKTAKELPADSFRVHPAIGSKPVPRHASSSPPTKPSTPETKVAINKKVFKTSSSLTKGVEKRSTKTVESERKKDLSTDKKKREKKIEGLIKNSKKDKTKDDSDKKRTKKKTENGKKKNGTKKKDKENLENTENEYELEQFGFDESGRPIKSDNFFQNLFLHSCKLSSHAVSAKRTAVVRSSSVAERARKLSEVDQNSVYKSEPSLRNFNVYLSQKRPVSESRFRSLERTSRQGSPSFSGYQMLERTDGYDRDIWEYCNQDTPAYESVRGRSSSEPPRTSPSEELYENIENMSPSVSRSPSCRRIRRAASSAKSIEGIAGIKKKVRSKSLNEADRYSQMGSASSLTDRPGYQCFIAEQVHSTRKSERFQELHKFYSSLERMAELQKATSNVDLRPRSKGEEIIDFDRWKMVRNKERAETELSRLYEQLKECQRDKDFLFKPRETVRWKGDRGLRSKEKSVEDLRQQFLKMSESDRQLKKHPTTNKDIYKPFWRGNSVADLANSLTCVTGSKRGRPVVECDRDLTKPVARISGDIGSRLWSSLSVEQVNALKSQLSEIYNTVSNLKHDRIRKMRNSLRDYEIDIAQFGSQEVLHVRRNSLVSENQLYSPTVKRSEAKRRERTKADSIGALPSYKSQLPMTEVEKKKLSMTISDEIKDRVKKRKHCSLVIPRETLGAVATIKGSKKQKSPTDSEISPRTCYSLLSDDSQEKGKDFLLVLTPKDKQHEVKKLVDDWGKNEYARVVQTTSTSSSSSASTVIHLGERESSHNKAGRSSGESPQRTLTSSQSFTNLKELFGEKHATTYATPPLKRNSPLSNSADSIYKCSSPDPMKYYRAYLSMVKAGDVRKLREKFESYDDIYNFLRSQDDGDIWRPKKRFQSDPDLTRDYLSRKGGREILRRQEVGDVQWLRRRYEPHKVSPVPLRTEDRYMPRINVISKTATLQRRSRTAPPKLETSRNKTGHVDRMRHFFETNEQLSLLGQMYTSTPEIPQLRDIAPYLECDWIAHRNPTRDLTPVKRTSGQRSSSVSPVRQSILKHQDMFADQEFNPEIHRPLYRYQPHSAGETATRWQQQGAHQQWTVTSRPSVTFKEPLGNPIPTPPRDHFSRQALQRGRESPHRYLESEVNIHYRSPIRTEAKAAWPEEELAQKQAEVMRRIYQEQRRTKYLNELHDMYSRRHTDNFIPSQKSPIPLNRYDDFPVEAKPVRPRDRTPEPKLVARALYNFVGQSSRELSFRRGDIIFVRRQIDKNWYEGEHNAMIGLFPFNYVEIIPYDGIRTLPKKATEGQARAKFNFQAQSHLEVSLVKGELVLLTRRVDENWFEGRIGNRKGIFPVSYVEVLVEPGEKNESPTGHMAGKPVVAPASHSVMLNGAKDLAQQHYQPPRPATYCTSSLPSKHKMGEIPLVSQTLHIDTQTNPVPYRVLYNYKPQNDDELELREGDIVYVMEKCDDGWYVGSTHANGQFGTFPGNYVQRIQ